MAKRQRDEVIAAEAITEDASKKVKKAKKDKKAKHDNVDQSGSKEITAISEDSKKAENALREDEDDANADSLSKAERKALRRAKKEQAKAAAGQEAIESAADGEGNAESIAKAEKKARKREEKAKKALEAVSKSAAGLNGQENPGKVPSKDAIASTTGASKAEADEFFREKQIAVEDPQNDDVRPILAFTSLPFDAATRSTYFSGFSSPTPIQSASWPYLIKGRDLIGVAETGSGKTFAFGVPCINRLSPDRKHIQVCIVSPTRELALQIHEQMTKLAQPRELKVVCVYGGMSKDDQRQQLTGCHIVVATPGRLNDFIGDGTIKLSHVNYLVLDEADRMLDKGFEQDVRKIMTAASSDKARQTIMFTATWPPSVRDLAAEFLRSPVRIMIGENASGELRANTRITQEVEVVDEYDKQGRLLQLLKKYQSGKNKKDRILVFCLYKKEATRIEEFIRRNGFPVAGIHGDLSQQKRMDSLETFKNGQVPLLVATDVAARGLDIPAVKLVVNVTFPLTVEDYVHRIGRTGRAGQDGRAITLFTQNEKGLAGALINVLKGANQPVPEELLKFGTTVKKKAHDAYGAFYKDTGDAKKATKITFD